MDQGYRMMLRSRKPSPLRLSDKGKLYAASLIVTGELPVGGQWLLMGMDGEGSSGWAQTSGAGPSLLLAAVLHVYTGASWPASQPTSPKCPGNKAT